MWNLTVRMARKPNVEDIQDLWENVNTASKPQKDVLSLTVEDIFLDSQEELLEIIEGAKRRWVLKVLHHGLNIGLSYDDLKNKDKKGLNALLECFQRPTHPPYNFVIPDLVQEYPQRQRDNIMILPLSIEDETTTAGTASILRNYAREFNLSCTPTANYLPKDQTGKFSLAAARERFNFYQG